MSTTTLDLTNSYSGKAIKPSVFAKFASWCTNQEENRLLWSGVGLTAHGCILTPITVLFVLLAGSQLEMTLLSLALIAMVMVLVTNLAALPTKITLPTLVLSVLIDVVVIIAAMLI